MAYPINGTLIDLLVLSVIEHHDSYGYEIGQWIKKVSPTTKESTLYPVLKRLQKENCVVTYDRPFQGRNRRYYEITVEGRNYRANLCEEWRIYRDAIDMIAEGGGIHDENRISGPIS